MTRVHTHNFEAGRRFAAEHGATFVETYEEVCRHPRWTTWTSARSRISACSRSRSAPRTASTCRCRSRSSTSAGDGAADDRDGAQRPASCWAWSASIGSTIASLFLLRAIADGRLGKLLQCDCYVKWYRSAEYYSRPIKGSWATEGGGALINQAIHQVDILRWLAGPVKEIFGVWQLGALHKIESEDVVNAVLRYANGATGVIQASTAFWPGYTERTEFHGTKGTAMISGDKLTTWDVRETIRRAGAGGREVASGASDPMAISLEPFERQFRDFGEAITKGRKPLVAGEEGVQAMEIVDAIYRSCRTGTKVVL